MAIEIPKERVAAAVAVVGCHLLAAIPVSRGWSRDDPILLLNAARHRAASYFFDPEVATEVSGFFTPLGLLSFDLDLRLFGLEPQAFHLHQLLAGSSVVLLFSLLLLRWTGRVLPAAVAGCVLAMSPVMVRLASRLDTRHYLEGGLWILLAALALDLARQRPRPWIAPLSALAYLLACLSKEVFVGLVVLPWLFDRGRGRGTSAEGRSASWTGAWWTRASAGASWIGASWIGASWGAALLLYLGWRGLVFGLGGYGAPVEASQVLALPGRLLALMSASSAGALAPWLLAISSLAAIALAAVGETRRVIGIGLVAVLTTLPVVGTLGQLSERHVLLPCALVALVHGLAWNRLLGGRDRLRVVAWIWMAAVFVGSLAAGRQIVRQEVAGQRQREVEARFVLREGEASDVLVGPREHPLHFWALVELRREAGLPPGPRVTYDLPCACEAVGEGEGESRQDRFWRFVAEGSGLEAEPWEQACRPERFGDRRDLEPLELELVDLGGAVRWQLGPYDRGRYALFLGEHCQRVAPVPRSGRLDADLDTMAANLDRAGRLAIRLRYDSPEGWWTASPSLGWNLEQATLSWRRAEDRGR